MLAEPKTRRAAVGPGFMPGLMGNGKGALNPALLGGMGMAGQGYVGGAGSQIISSLNSAGLMGQGCVEWTEQQPGQQGGQGTLR